MSDNFYSWAWTPHYVQRAEQAESLLLLPDDSNVQPALIHFSKLTLDGEVHSWLWFFESEIEARRLYLLPSVAPTQTDETKIINSTIPQNGRDRYLQVVPKSWLDGLDLEVNGITEVRIGFDYKAYIRTGEMLKSCQQYSVREFLAQVRK